MLQTVRSRNPEPTLVPGVFFLVKVDSVEKKLAIVFSDFLAQAACMSHLRWRLQCVAGHCCYQLLVFFSFGPGGFECVTRSRICNAQIAVVILPSSVPRLAQLSQHYYCSSQTPPPNRESIQKPLAILSGGCNLAGNITSNPLEDLGDKKDLTLSATKRLP